MTDCLCNDAAGVICTLCASKRGPLLIDLEEDKQPAECPNPRTDEGDEIHRILDEEGVPRSTRFGTDLTLWGRINFYFGRRP